MPKGNPLQIENIRQQALVELQQPANPITLSNQATPVREKQRSPIITPEKELEPASSRVEENTKALIQIEGHNLTDEDRRSREHIHYNLPNLNSLPRRSSASMTYLSASQRKLRRNEKSATEADEIQSRLRATEERISCVPIQFFNRFQILQRGPRRQGAAPHATKSL